MIKYFEENRSLLNDSVNREKKLQTYHATKACIFSMINNILYYMIFGADRSLVLVLRSLIVANTFVLK